ncbi:hypothetical protein BGZ95_000076, partial [Linnemannia exigua]
TRSLAWALVSLTATTAIISVTDASPCEDCIFAAIYTQSPTCTTQIFSTQLQEGPLTEEQKSCLCPLASSDTWLQQCIKPEFCTAEDVNHQLTGFKGLREKACGNAVPPTKTADKVPASPTGTNAASCLNFSSRVAVGAVVAVFAVLM